MVTTRAMAAAGTPDRTRPIGYAFGGPLGCVVTFLLVVPAIIVGLFVVCSETGCPAVPTIEVSSAWWRVRIDGMEVFSARGCLLYMGWTAYLALLHIVLPGKKVQGVLLSDGKTRLDYHLNGLLQCTVAFATLILVHATHVLDLASLYDHVLSMITTSLLWTFFLSVYLLARPCAPKDLSEAGRLGNTVYSFFMGKELNPRIGGFDLKFFSEQRTSCIGWGAVCFIMMAKQYEQLQYVPNSMILVNAFQWMYIFDTFVFEAAVLTTMDITLEGYGFMLAMGCYCWVPFVHSFQARYLVLYPKVLDTWVMVLLVVVHTLGYAIFRLSNLEKNKFRSNPDDPQLKHMKYIKTESGSRLLISGWWGMARHINYFGDWLMSLCQCLCCGFEHFPPYFFAFYFATLLIHRQIRDDEKCSAKYGKYWTEYTKRVPSRIIPYIY